MRREHWAMAAVALVAILAATGCGMEGGANLNQKTVGNQPGGVQLGLGDIAVAPVGDYVVFMQGASLAVGFNATGEVSGLPVKQVTLLAFSSMRQVIYVWSSSGGESEIVAVDVTLATVLWRTHVEDAGGNLKLAVSDDDRYVLAASSRTVGILDGATGAVHGSHALDQNIVDLRVLGDSSRALVVQRHTNSGAPSTLVKVIELESNTVRRIHLPNCSGILALSKDGRRAFLAPTTCENREKEVVDPVSVIDLTPGAEDFVRNLPGFGPVAISPDGTRAIAFFDASNPDLALFDDPSLAPSDLVARYYLMIIDPATLTYDFAPVGDELPRYAITPDGNVLLVDSHYDTTVKVRLFDIPTRTFRDILAPPRFVLDNFVMSGDSRHAYVLFNFTSLYDLDITRARANPIDPGFTPLNINISADDTLLFLRRNDHEICIFDLGTQACRGSFVGDTIVDQPGQES